MKKLALLAALMCSASTLVMAQSATSDTSTSGSGSMNGGAMNNSASTSGSTVTGTTTTSTNLGSPNGSGMGTPAAPGAMPSAMNGPASSQTTGATTGQTATTGTPTNPSTLSATGPSTTSTTNQMANGVNTAAPLKGANSFTKKEAMHRLEKSGYTNVAGLSKDSQSVWRGTAVKSGQPVNVALDFKGNITEGTSGTSTTGTLTR